MFTADDLRSVLNEDASPEPYDLTAPDDDELPHIAQDVDADLPGYIRSRLEIWWADLFESRQHRAIYTYLGLELPREWDEMRAALVAQGYGVEIRRRPTGAWLLLRI